MYQVKTQFENGHGLKFDFPCAEMAWQMGQKVADYMKALGACVWSVSIRDAENQELVAWNL